MAADHQKSLQISYKENVEFEAPLAFETDCSALRGELPTPLSGSVQLAEFKSRVESRVFGLKVHFRLLEKYRTLADPLSF